MRVVGTAAGIDIHSPDDAYFSYFNSPYIGHSLGSAIDIYPSHQEWGGDVESPVSGRIVKIKKMKMGRPKQFPTDEYDFAIGILPESSDTKIVRIMHCIPTVAEGDSVDLGDSLGKSLRSRYFNYWTGPHYHVEILHLESFQRSSQSLPLELDYQFDSSQINPSRDSVEFIINTVTDDNIIGYAKNLGFSSIRDLYGLAASVSDRGDVGILDGGLSHYKIGGVIGTGSLPEGELVSLNGSAIGSISDVKSGASLFLRGPSLFAFLDNIELRGLSCFIYPKQYTKEGFPQLILIPKFYGQFTDLFQTGQVCELRLSSNNNMVKGKHG